jgi:formylglycine-generating enzyme required for sulfatase activity
MAAEAWRPAKLGRDLTIKDESPAVGRCQGDIRLKTPIATLLLSAAVAALLLAGSAGSSTARLGKLYDQAVDAASEGRWRDSFSLLHDLCNQMPGFRDAEDRLSEAAPRAVHDLQPGTAWEPERVLLRWLAANEEWGLLAEAFDRSEVPIRAGEFWMGTEDGRTDERPARRVFLDAFLIDRYEVTNTQYQRFLGESGRPIPRYWSGASFPEGQADMPVVGVGWDEAQAYCEWAGKRLPTEAEWERACRGQDGRIYPWGDEWDIDLANVGVLPEPTWGTWLDDAWQLAQVTPSASAPAGLRAVGSYSLGASPDGVLDMVGNVAEWVLDYYSPAGYAGLPDHNPINTTPPWAHSLRGSSWLNRYGLDEWLADHSRCAGRNSSHMAGSPRVGFRCARAAVSPMED